VSDRACLKCHDGAVHSANQVGLLPNGDTSADRFKNTSCTHCHVEHRGEAALRAASDAHCVQCHADLNAPGRTKAPATSESKVLAFSLGKHPAFGRNLTADRKPLGLASQDAGASESSGESAGLAQVVLDKVQDKKTGKSTLMDPTVLRFNHQTHLKMKEFTPFGDNSCSLCHTTLDPDPNAKVNAGPAAPPWAGSKARGSQWGVVDQRAYMLPVSYERHCAGCHSLSVPLSPAGDDTPAGDPYPLPHDRMDVVRQVIAGIPPERLGWLGVKPAAPPPAAGAPAEGTTKPAEPAPTGRGRGRGSGQLTPRAGEGRVQLTMLLARGGSKPEGGETPPAAAAGAGATPGMPGFNYEKLYQAIDGGSFPKQEGAKDAVRREFKRRTGLDLDTPVEDPSKAKAPDYRAVVEFYTAYLASTSCSLCHNVQGSIAASGGAAGAAGAADKPAEGAQPAAAATPAAPATGPAQGKSMCMSELGLTEGDDHPLQTVPTGIPSTPRRWYTNSRFDHAGHRNMKCVECHSRARTSDATCDVLSPNLVWTNDKNEIRSCVECHHQPTSTDRGAGANCQTCHVYHPRTGTAGEGRPGQLLTMNELVGPARHHAAAAPGAAADGAGGAAPAEKPAAP